MPDMSTLNNILQKILFQALAILSSGNNYTSSLKVSTPHMCWLAVTSLIIDVSSYMIHHVKTETALSNRTNT